MPRRQDQHSAARAANNAGAADCLFGGEQGAGSPSFVKIVPKRGGRDVEVRVGRERFGPLPPSAIADLGLRDGGVWDDSRRGEVLDAVARAACRRRAAALLRVKPRTRAELRDRLVATGFGPALAAGVVESLAASGIVNDAAIAEREALGCTRGPLAEPALRDRLRARGIEDADLSAIEVPRADDLTAATGMARRLITPSKTGVARRGAASRRRVYSALLRRGFDEETSARAVDAVLGPDADRDA